MPCLSNRARMGSRACPLSNLCAWLSQVYHRSTHPPDRRGPPCSRRLGTPARSVSSHRLCGGSRGGTSGGSPRSWRTDRRTAASARAQPDGHGDEWTEHQHRRARSKAERQHRAHRSKLAKCVPVTEWLAESIAGDRVKGPEDARVRCATCGTRARSGVSAPADPPAGQRTGYSR